MATKTFSPAGRWPKLTNLAASGSSARVSGHFHFPQTVGEPEDRGLSGCAGYDFQIQFIGIGFVSGLPTHDSYAGQDADLFEEIFVGTARLRGLRLKTICHLRRESLHDVREIAVLQGPEKGLQGRLRGGVSEKPCR